jgi:hypothetical protein
MLTISSAGEVNRDSGLRLVAAFNLRRIRRHSPDTNFRGISMGWELFYPA